MSFSEASDAEPRSQSLSRVFESLTCEEWYHDGIESQRACAVRRSPRGQTYQNIVGLDIRVHHVALP